MASVGTVHSIRFMGRSAGAFKTLQGYSKARHTVPDAVNSTTLGFLAKVAAPDLGEEAETQFQRARTGLGYKRKDIALELSPPNATITARDFTLEIAYSFHGDDPTRYETVRTLRDASSLDFLCSPACGEVFAAQFAELAFSLRKGAPVESVIDAVEALEGKRDLSVTYPSDCRDCLIQVNGVDAEVRFDGGELTMIFPRPGAPGELMQAFMRVRERFRLTESPELAGLLA